MFIRLYANATNKEDASIVFQKVLSVFNAKIKDTEVIKIEPYWKIESVYVIEVIINFYDTINHKDLSKDLEAIADKWLNFGNPINEMVATDTTDDCHFILDGVKMINIHF